MNPKYPKVSLIKSSLDEVDVHSASFWTRTCRSKTFPNFKDVPDSRTDPETILRASSLPQPGDEDSGGLLLYPASLSWGSTHLGGSPLDQGHLWRVCVLISKDELRRRQDAAVPGPDRDEIQGRTS